jgi:hypothetical protein
MIGAVAGVRAHRKRHGSTITKGPLNTPVIIDGVQILTDADRDHYQVSTERVLCFNGAVSGQGIDSAGMCKRFPRGVNYFLVEALVAYKSNVWSNELWTAWDKGLVEFLESKGAAGVHAEFVAAIKKRGRATLPNCVSGYFSSRRIRGLLDDRPGRPGFATLYAKCGIRAVLCKKIVGLEPADPSAPPDVRTFLWVELVDEAVMAEPGAVYNSAQALARPQ